MSIVSENEPLSVATCLSAHTAISTVNDGANHVFSGWLLPKTMIYFEAQTKSREGSACN